MTTDACTIISKKWGNITSIHLTITYITHDTTDKTMQNFGNIDVGEGC